MRLTLGKGILLAIALLVLAQAQAAEPAWTLVEDEGGIQVYNASEPDAAGRFFIKGVMHDSIPLAVVGNVLLDFVHYPTWMTELVEVRVVRSATPDDFILYTRSHLAWPFEDRDVYTHVTIARDYVHGVFTADLRKIDSPEFPPIEGRVRMPSMEVHVTMRYLDAAQTTGEFTEHSDVGGVFPHWLSERINKKVPREFLGLLGKACRNPSNVKAAQESVIAQELGRQLVIAPKK